MYKKPKFPQLSVLAAAMVVAQPFLWLSPLDAAEKKTDKMNVLLVISDDLTLTALSCYGNEVCKTPNIDKFATQGVRFTGSYCQTPYCGPSRASMLFGYYPDATGMYAYQSGRKEVGDKRDSWPQHFKKNGYHTARVSKVFHMGVPGDIEKGSDSSDDVASWVERYNSQGPEWKAPGKAEKLENNPDREKKGPMGGNRFVVVEADGDDYVHSDGKTANKAVELLKGFKDLDQPFFLAVGFVRPHVPFVAPKKYFVPFQWEDMVLPKKLKDDWSDIPKLGINYKTSKNMKMDVERQKKAVAGYYACVTYVDTMFGQVMSALEENGQRDNTIVIFTSDHGYHLGEHDFWAKVSLHEESAAIPLIISVPGREPAVCSSFVELIDLYPTVSALCGLEIPKNIQGKDCSPMLVDPTFTVRDAAWCSNKSAKLLRGKRWVYISYGREGSEGEELFDMSKDPEQFTNQAKNPEYIEQLKVMRERMKKRLTEISTNDLDAKIKVKKKRKKK